MDFDIPQNKMAESAERVVDRAFDEAETSRQFLHSGVLPDDLLEGRLIDHLEIGRRLHQRRRERQDEEMPRHGDATLARHRDNPVEHATRSLVPEPFAVDRAGADGAGRRRFHTRRQAVVGGMSMREHDKNRAKFWLDPVPGTQPGASVLRSFNSSSGL